MWSVTIVDDVHGEEEISREYFEEVVLLANVAVVVAAEIEASY